MAAAVETTSAPAPASRSLLLPIAGIGVLIIVAVVLALVALRRPQATYPPHSPERAVQRYFDLLQAGRVEQAYRMTRFSGPSPYGTPRDNFHAQWDNWSQTSHNVTLVSASQTGSTATVTVGVTAFSAGLTGSDQAAERVTFTLTRYKPNTWYITGPETIYLP